MRLIRILSIAFYLVSLCALFLYSFVQVDLGLTLTNHPFFLPYQKSFQQIGYFQRPLSTYLYLIILTSLVITYLSFLYLALRNYLSVRVVGVLSVITFCVLVFSYNAFSYDLFNYIFDARILTHYGDNPYEKRALDYPTDYHLGFMRWIHRTYPYGPLWLGFSVPLSYASFGSLLTAMVFFKLLAGISYLGCVWFIKKIVTAVSSRETAFAMVFFACNPLVIIESLVSGHNDIVMMVFALLSLYLLITKRIFLSYFSLAVSIAVKFATVFLLPVYVYIFFNKDWVKQFSFVISLMVVLLLTAVLAATVRTQFQPWYLLFVLPFAALISKKDYIFIPAIFLTITSLLNYVPYFFTGNWDDPIPQILITINLVGVGLSVGILILYRIIRRVILRPHLIEV